MKTMSSQGQTVCKNCSVCGINKPLSDFHKAANGKHGRKSRCKQCNIKQAKDWRNNQISDPEKADRFRLAERRAKHKKRHGSDACSSGVVYVVSNESLPGVLKIGATTRSANERVKELSDSTSIPSDFVLIASFQSSDAYRLEGNIHRALEIYRVSQRKEFFRISESEALAKIGEELEKF